MPTMGARLELIKGGTKAIRHTGSVIYQVASGHGWSEIGDRRYEWEEKDVFAIPAWTRYRHGASSEAVLFSFNDFRRCARSACTAKEIRNSVSLASAARRAGMPVIYANNHFGNWQSDFHRLIEECRESERCGRAIVALLEPKPKDFAVLKPRHSAFYGTPLE
jgi:nicotinamidase-related amidase